MNIPRILGLGILITIAAAAGAKNPEPVAIVYSLTGEASLARHPLRLFDRLPVGAALEVGPGSRLALAFVSGLRYELGEGARVTLGAKDLASRTGPVRPLLRVPPLPRLAPIARKEQPGPKAGAVRIRAEEIGNLSPRGGAVTLADATVLRFQGAKGAARYQLEIQDARGTVIFRITTEVSAVSVPVGILSPGSRYHWTVQTLDRPGPEVRGEADFVTLSRKESKAREKLRKALEPMRDDGSRALLAAVDYALGLTQENPGVLVESVGPRSTGETAGLRPGDTILSWSHANASGSVRHPYDLLPIEIEEASRRPVTLRGKRDSQEMEWTLTAAEWGIETRPNLADAPEAARSAGEERLAAWVLDRRARSLAKEGKWSEADTAYQEALVILERTSEHPAAAELLRSWGRTFLRRSAWDAAEERFRKALEIDRRTGSKSLAQARTLDLLGVTAGMRGDYPAAEELLRQALAIREELAPGTAEVTGNLNNLAIVARRRGDLATAEEYLTRGEEIQRRLAPDSANHALFFQNLGNLASDRGDLKKAGELFHRALVIFEKIDPESDSVVACLDSLANVAIFRGDLATAGDLLQRSLTLQEKRIPEDLKTSLTLISLGYLASRRGDQEGAEALYRRALALQEKLAPDSFEIASSLGNLGVVAALQGDFTAARTYLRRSLAIKETLAPGSVKVAVALEQLGRLEFDSGGDLAKAEELLRQSVALFEKQEAEGLGLSEALRGLGHVVARRGRLPEAIALYRQALDLQRRIAPNTTGEAEALHLLGLAERQVDRPQESARDLCQAIDILDGQRTRLGGTPETRASFEASISDYYHACLEGLLQLGRPAEAFHVLERGRARSFLALLAERDLRLSDLPQDLAAERRHVNAEYDRVQSHLARLSAGRDDAEIERLTDKLRDLRSRQEEIVARIRKESPRSAALQDPQPLDLASARAALDPGTVLLAYTVGPESAWLFVVEPADASGPGLSVLRIDTDMNLLRKDVEDFRRLLKRSSSERTALRTRARRLYRLLIGPAEKRITTAKRILVSADGPLHTLPFAALMRGDHYLVEWKPIHSVLSATVYAESGRSKPSQRIPGKELLAALGDPAYPSTPGAPNDPEVRDSIRRGLTLKPLPASREEIEAIAILYPQAQVYLGREATEEKAKSIGPRTDFVHFACHGLLDEDFPLNSALALTLPEKPAEGQDNGLLQAWEIFESVRLNADLVTLSACDTALGREMGGEGLVGLTRAFQYAGARSVLASLWGVSDRSTADLMKRFYSYLKQGRSKDEALRSAQVDLIRSKAFAHPYHWAAFQLTGDWR